MLAGETLARGREPGDGLLRPTQSKERKKSLLLLLSVSVSLSISCYL
jgi:hypothetical protein